jgi:hypothetical protein
MKLFQQQDRPLLEATLESTEIVADMLMKGDVIAEIPVIGTAFKVCKAADSIRDRIFATKLFKFVKCLNAIPEKTKEQMRHKLMSSPEEARRIGETLVLVLDRVTDLDKPILLAQLFVAYIDQIISVDDLRRMAQAVDESFLDDLLKFIEIQELSYQSEDEWMQCLVSSGLTRPVGGGTYGDIGRIYYQPTPLGQKLHDTFEKLTSDQN